MKWLKNEAADTLDFSIYWEIFVFFLGNVPTTSVITSWGKVFFRDSVSEQDKISDTQQKTSIVHIVTCVCGCECVDRSPQTRCKISALTSCGQNGSINFSAQFSRAAVCLLHSLLLDFCSKRRPTLLWRGCNDSTRYCERRKTKISAVCAKSRGQLLAPLMVPSGRMSPGVPDICWKLLAECWWRAVPVSVCFWDGKAHINNHWQVEHEKI